MTGDSYVANLHSGPVLRFFSRSKAAIQDFVLDLEHNQMGYELKDNEFLGYQLDVLPCDAVREAYEVWHPDGFIKTAPHNEWLADNLQPEEVVAACGAVADVIYACPRYFTRESTARLAEFAGSGTDGFTAEQRGIFNQRHAWMFPGEDQSQIIAISGKAGHGKDTMCEAIQRVCHLDIRRLALADPLKSEASAMLAGYEYSFAREAEQWEEARWEYWRLMMNRSTKERFRAIQIWWGTEWRRLGFTETYWTELLRNDMLRCLGDKAVFTITDIRFPNEAGLVTVLGGSVMRVNRPSVVSTNNHPSETAMDDYSDFCMVVTNEGTIEDMEVHAVRLCEQLGLPLRGVAHV